jgi:hypothetical protein
MNLVWDLSKPTNDIANDIITNNVIDFVGAQIESNTNQSWNSIVSYRELKSKVALVFHRQKGKLNESEEKKAAKQKFSVRKNRRVTVS